MAKEDKALIKHNVPIKLLNSFKSLNLILITTNAYISKNVFFSTYFKYASKSEYSDLLIISYFPDFYFSFLDLFDIW